MPTDHRSALASIKRFDQLIAYLRDEMGWPIAMGLDFEDAGRSVLRLHRQPSSASTRRHAAKNREY